jgi:hypothetical protein
LYQVPLKPRALLLDLALPLLKAALLPHLSDPCLVVPLLLWARVALLHPAQVLVQLQTHWGHDALAVAVVNLPALQLMDGTMMMVWILMSRHRRVRRPAGGA